MRKSLKTNKKKKKQNKKKCRYCRRAFTPNPRLGSRQISCKDKECRKKRKKHAQKKWHQSNPDYFQDRYEYVKWWRERHPGYQKSLRRRGREIQDTIIEKG